MYPKQFLTKLEGILAKTITSKYPFSWDEDHITFSILDEIYRKLSNVRIYGYHRNMRINWQIFKQKGKIEHYYGDIGLIVEITHQDRDRIEGVAFLEAKKRYQGKTSFDAIKMSQLEEIGQGIQNAKVLLYDYEDISQYAHITPLPYMREWFSWKPCTNSVVVPLEIVTLTGKHDTSIYKFSVPFSYQLFFRYFNGFDLDLTKTALDTAKGFSDKRSIPKYLLIASVAVGEAETRKGTMVNREIFQAFS